MTGPVIEDGCVVVEGDRIIAVGPTADLAPGQIDEQIDGLLMPGLINAHTHLELTNVPRPEKPGAFQDWLLTTMAAVREADFEAFRMKRATAVREGIAQCLRFGVTCVGDISQNVDIVRPILRDGAIRSVSFGECLGLGPRRARFAELLARAADDATASERMQIGISPHAPYTVDVAGYQEVNQYAQRGVLLSTHLAETPDEQAFVATRSGPFRSLYERLGFDPGPPGEGRRQRPLEMLFLDAGAAGNRWLLAHMNYCDDNDLALLSQNPQAGVVWCPRTHRYFGHPPHPWRRMRERGVVVCVGTDSCASAGDLNLVDDLRLLYADGERDVEAIWAMVTRDAWRAMPWGRGDAGSANDPLLGALVPGAMADLVAFPTTGGEPLREILETPGLLPAGVWICGVRQTP